MKKRFGDIEAAYSDPVTAEIFLQSIPYDGTSTWGKGADKGFSAFLEAAKNMELYDIETDSEVYKRGIFIVDELSGFSSPEDMFDRVYLRTHELLSTGRFLTFFGGEHSISIGIIKAFYEHFDDLSILHIDAHADLRPSYMGTPFNHACALYDASRNSNLVQVGIRSMDITEKKYINQDQIFFAEEIRHERDWIESVVNKLSGKVYITFDLDALDPSIMPATGTPEPGGLSWYTTLDLLGVVFSRYEVVGFDIVELAPIPTLKSPDFLAAKLYYKMLSYKFRDAS